MKSIFTSIKDEYQGRHKIAGGMYECLRWTLLMGKCGFFIPLTGFRSHETLRFTWKSVYVFFCLLNIFIQVFMLLLILNDVVFYGIHGKVSTVFYYTFYLTTTLLMFLFSKRFEDFISSIERVEILLPPLRRPRSTVRFISIFSGIMMILSIMDHILYHLYSFSITNICNEHTRSYWKSYSKVMFDWYFNIFSFSHIPVTIFEVVKLQHSVIRVFSDVLIMSISIYLKKRFNDFNEVIIGNKSAFHASFRPSWSELQLYYTKISKLVAIVDEHINCIVFISYSSNLYFISLSLYGVLNQVTGANVLDTTSNCTEQHRDDLIPVMSQVFVIGFMVVRTCMVSILAAEVNTASRLPLLVLHIVPADKYDIYFKRLMSQVYYSKISLSGLNLFHISRGMMLAMVAKMLTYEIVLVQV